MRNSKIHPTAIVDGGASVAEGVEIGAYAIVENNVVIGEGTVVEPHARLCSGARVGKFCRICSFSTISGIPQDVHFDVSTPSYVEIGDATVVRENFTIHRATVPNSSTKIGRNCFLMASSHIGHDCVLRDNVIMGCFSAVAGFTEVGSDSFISGGVMLHQRIRIGNGVMISGNSAFSTDLPPYVNGLKRNRIQGLNLIGMARRKMPREAVSDIKNLFMFVYSGLPVRKRALEALQNSMAKTPEGIEFLKFFQPEGRHFASLNKERD